MLTMSRSISNRSSIYFAHQPTKLAGWTRHLRKTIVWDLDQVWSGHHSRKCSLKGFFFSLLKHELKPGIHVPRVVQSTTLQHWLAIGNRLGYWFCKGSTTSLLKASQITHHRRKDDHPVALWGIASFSEHLGNLGEPWEPWRLAPGKAKQPEFFLNERVQTCSRCNSPRADAPLGCV